MANMKKFTTAQREYVDGLQDRINRLQETLREERREHDKLKKANEELVNNSVRAQGDLDGQLQRSREMHRALLGAVEDYMDAEGGKQLADRRHEAALGRLGDMHSEHGEELQYEQPVPMTFTPDPKETFGWRRTNR